MWLKAKLILAGLAIAIMGILKLRNSRLSNKLNKIEVDNLKARADYMQAQSVLAKDAYKTGVKRVEIELKKAEDPNYNPFRDDN